MASLSFLTRFLTVIGRVSGRCQWTIRATKGRPNHIEMGSVFWSIGPLRVYLARLPIASNRLSQEQHLSIPAQIPAHSTRVLHIAGWYPGPWSKIEGNFVQAHVRLFLKEARGSAIVVQVRRSQETWFKLRMLEPEEGVQGSYLLTKMPVGRLTEFLSSLLLVFALVRARAWRFDVLHFHIAYPLLIHVDYWHWIFRKPVIISEHWSAYHYNFNLSDDSRALAALRRPFQHGFPVLAVSGALLNDIRRFSRCDDLRGCVIPNVVPIHGARATENDIPVLFCVGRWVEIKDPMPMLLGLSQLRLSGTLFELVIGGFGPLIEPMKMLVANSSLADCTSFLGELTKAQIADQLGKSDGYLFSSKYETFSVACAEALGAGVPLIGPQIPAISEYATRADWQRVETRDAEGWAHAAKEFLRRISACEFDRAAIARRAAIRFSSERIRSAYREILDTEVSSNN